MRLTGWWRLWIVLSALWALGAFLVAIKDYPTPAYYEAATTSVIMSTGADSAERASLHELARLQSEPAQLDAYRNAWWLQNGLIAAVPPILLGIAFLLVAWIRGGFASRS